MALYAIGEALIDFVPSRPGKPDADIRYIRSRYEGMTGIHSERF